MIHPTKWCPPNDGKGHLTRDGNEVATKIALKPLEKPESQNELWVIKLPEALK
ncbi:hypothetical protein OH773_11350 [Buttiauxella sp. WJP83]|uniref:hypothetical protein n=1 Tax=Buttiauxella sp. WJP83 TaxID=2986951 RepID=UPI0022DDD176|nr:hypothetical protein [Buttiauxella sp. WJP83]WBM72926.1 hypothetical protein OH773_11350 [Buttiauxella sp. WJP83]